MIYADVATERAIDRTLTYHVPPELEGVLQPGHLVRLDLRTAAEPGIVMGIHDEPPSYPDGRLIKTKPVLEILDPQPVVTPRQMALARWMSARYLSPLGPCLWLMLPPGLVGKRDVLVSLRNENTTGSEADEIKIIDALKRRGILSGTQLGRVVKGQKRANVAIRALERAGVIRTESILAPPRVKPRKIQVASLAIHPDHIQHIRRRLGKSNRLAEALETIIRLEDDEGAPPHISDILAIPGVGEATIEQLLTSGWVDIYDDEFLQPHDEADEALFELRGGETDLHILQILARDGGPVDVSWIYAQADAKLSDLKRLETAGFITLSEEQSYRDSLAERDFVPSIAPRLTEGQRVVWRVVARGLKEEDPHPASPVDRGGARPSVEGDDLQTRGSAAARGEQGHRHITAIPSQADSPPSPSTGRGAGGVGSDDDTDSSPRRADRWLSPPNIWRKIMPLAQQKRLEPTPAENRLWQHLRQKQLHGYRFRRQHAIDRFIADFYCKDARLIIEVDGPIHQYTQEEDTIREEFLEAMGFRVLRFTNEQVLDTLDDVLDVISKILLDPHPTTPVDRGGVRSLVEGDDFQTGQSGEERGERGNAQSSIIPSQPDSPPSLSTGRGAGGAGSLFLLHGVTGSGKTEIYLRAIERVLAQGRQAIFLVPEIALTAQTIRRVAARFPGQVAVVHSGLSDGERYDTWRRARMGEIGVVIGARSALFTPLPDVGLVILDEEHDDSYKQSPPITPPYYHTRDVAERMMRDNNGLLILGTATPDVETFYRSGRGEIGYLRLPDRIMGHRVRIHEQSERAGVDARYDEADSTDAVTIPLPPVDVIDMRAELRAGNTGMFSAALLDALGETLSRGEQAILFLNRRGASTYVFCRDCGYVARCKNCDMPMTFHAHDRKLHCHHCGRIERNPTQCPACGSHRIRYFGAGTQQVEAAFAEHFPDAVALRWDGDTASKPDAHDLILDRFINRQADVMIGTQMVAKGLDLPLVTLVGVVSADVGLNLPDFRAGERTFQLLMQVAGRAGRGLLGGRVILQSYQPDHYAVQMASGHDYAGFYDREIAYRREMGYPPFRRIARILFTDPVEQKARYDAERAAEKLEHHMEARQFTGTGMIGPAPCFFGRINRWYRWQILLRGPDPSRVLRGMDFGPRAYIDVNPVEIL